MSNLGQIPTDYKKFLDQTLHYYLPKVNKVRNYFNNVPVDSGDVTLEYVRQTQSYTAAKGYTSFNDPPALADGSNPTIDSLGTEDATSSPTTYATGYRMDRKLLNSAKPIINKYITQHAVEMAMIIENFVNRTLLTNMASNAAQTYSASATWSTTGDAVADVIAAKAAFKDRSGGIPADFMMVNTNEWADIAIDDRFQSTLYTTSNQISTGTVTPKPLGLDFLVDPAVTTGSFFMGKRGMFADMMITENYKTYEKDEEARGKTYSGLFTFVDQYKLPYYLMYGTGI